MFSDLRKKAKTVNEGGQEVTPPKPEAVRPGAGEQETPPDPGEEALPKPAEAPAAEKSKGKVNPWKLVEEYKTKLSAVEQQIAQSKTATLAEQEKKAYEEKVARAEARAKELDEEIRFVNYSKSEEFKKQYQEPYQEAWKNAMSELSELTVQDEANQIVRPATAEDLLNLVNLPLGKARELAVATFGDFADDAMAHRKEIRRLFDAQTKALDTAKKAGEERDKARSDGYKKFITEASTRIKEHWDKTNQAILSDPKYGQYFKPVDGDEEGNQRLAKGFELADRAFSENPMDPSLSPEVRASIVKRHAAVRNRAAAFGRLVHQNQKLSEELAEARKTISSYKGSEPGSSDTRSSQSSEATYRPGSAREAMLADLRKRAKPV